jgi:hypothetical protein
MREEMEEQEGFEEVIYGLNCKKQRQVIIGTSRDSEMKVEKKTASKISQENYPENHNRRVRRFVNRKGIKKEVVVEELKTMGSYKAFKLGFPFENLQLMQNLEFWPQRTRIRPFWSSFRTSRQHQWARVDM